MANINRVVLVGNLTRDPELRNTPSGMSVCSLRIAVNTRRKDSSTGQWTEKPNYFDVTVWGNQGESCAQYLSKGRPVAIDGRLEWREWDAQDGTKRQAVEIIADSVQFLGGRGDGDGGGDGGNQFVPSGATSGEPMSVERRSASLTAVAFAFLASRARLASTRSSTDAAGPVGTCGFFASGLFIRSIVCAIPVCPPGISPSL